MTPTANMTSEQHILQMMELIRQSRAMTDNQKKKYIESIQTGNLSEEMMEEVSKLFEQDAQLLDQEISASKEGVTILEQEITEEQASIDEPQAKLLAALEDFHEKEGRQFGQTLEGMEKDLEKMEESAKKEDEKAAEDSIRAKLQQK
ncbi:MAG: hypothetical protein AB7J40_05590 [Candidatus Altimarinota bacterium]